MANGQGGYRINAGRKKKAENIIRRIIKAKNGTQTLYLNVYNGDGTHTNYYGRTGAMSGWDWSCREPNPAE